MDDPYNKREMDAKLEGVAATSDSNRELLTQKIDDMQSVIELRLSDLRRDTTNAVQGVQSDVTDIKTQVKYTNGKVRKIIIALVLIAGVIIGQNFPSTHDVISLLAGISF